LGQPWARPHRFGGVFLLCRVIPAFRSLQHRNFRLYYAGQSVSLIGTWMQRLAVGWLV